MDDNSKLDCLQSNINSLFEKVQQLEGMIYEKSSELYQLKTDFETLQNSKI